MINLINWIEEHTKGLHLVWLRRLRFGRAVTYYQAVREGGSLKDQGSGPGVQGSKDRDQGSGTRGQKGKGVGQET